MAKEFVTIVRDDIDGSEGADTVEFSVDGVDYTIDLGEKNAAKLRKALAEFIQHATVVEAAKAGKGGRKAAPIVTSRTDVLAQRAFWGVEENRAKYELPAFNDRGRIPGTVVDAWRTAGSPR